MISRFGYKLIENSSPSENGVMEPKGPMRFGGDEGHPLLILWQYDWIPTVDGINPTTPGMYKTLWTMG